MNIDTRIKYRHLVCFLEMARQGSLARAADVLAVSQPAMSKTLKELEALLTVSLFVRSIELETGTYEDIILNKYTAVEG